MKSKTFILPADAKVSLWSEDDKMCVGIDAAHLPKGTRITTRSSGGSGKNLAEYWRYLSMLPIVAELNRYGYDIENVGGEDFTVYEQNEPVISFVWLKDALATIDITAHPIEREFNAYPLAECLVRLLRAYDRPIVRVRQTNLSVTGSLIQLAIDKDTRINIDDQQIEQVAPGDQHQPSFRMTKSKSTGHLSFSIDEASMDSIAFANRCIQVLGAYDVPIVQDESLADPAKRQELKRLDPQQDYLAVHKGEYSLHRNPDGTTAQLWRIVIHHETFIIHAAFLAGELHEVKFAGPDRRLMPGGQKQQALAKKVFYSIYPMLEPDTQTEKDAAKLAQWTEKLRSQGALDPQAAAQVLIAQGMV